MQMEWSYVGAVVISGLAIVFAALIILIFLVWIMGKIFDKLNAKKSGGNAKKAPAAESSKPAPVNCLGKSCRRRKYTCFLSVIF